MFNLLDFWLDSVDGIIFPKVEHKEDGVILKYNLAGTEKEKIDLSIKNKRLIVKIKEGLPVISEYLPDWLDLDSIKAEYKNGMLFVYINRAKNKEDKSIQVN